MRIEASSHQTYLVLNGLSVSKPIPLGDGVELLPAQLNADIELIWKLLPTMPDHAIAAIFLGSCQSQIRVTALDEEHTAMKAWNTIWDGVILGAIFDCEVACNFQSSVPLERLDLGSKLRVTNYQLRAFPSVENYVVTDDDVAFITKNFIKFRTFLDNEMFRNAIHALATFRWHTMPRARLAVLWAGIEGLFSIDSELVFRISLYAARFMAPEDRDEQRKIFDSVKRLYKARSQAVHGSKMIGSPEDLVVESAELLRQLLIHCVESNGLPNTDILAP